MRNVRHREGKKLAEGHTAHRRSGQVLQPQLQHPARMTSRSLLCLPVQVANNREMWQSKVKRQPDRYLTASPQRWPNASQG